MTLSFTPKTNVTACDHVCTPQTSVTVYGHTFTPAFYTNMKRKISTWTSAKCSQFHVYYNFASGCIAAPNLITPSTNTKNQVRNNLQIKKTTKAMSTEKACVKDHRGLKIGGLLGEGFTRLEIREKGFGESSLSSGVVSNQGGLSFKGFTVLHM